MIIISIWKCDCRKVSTMTVINCIDTRSTRVWTQTKFATELLKGWCYRRRKLDEDDMYATKERLPGTRQFVHWTTDIFLFLCRKMKAEIMLISLKSKILNYLKSNWASILNELVNEECSFHNSYQQKEKYAERKTFMKGTLDIFINF